jgi:hypothetical protein
LANFSNFAVSFEVVSFPPFPLSEKIGAKSSVISSVIPKFTKLMRYSPYGVFPAEKMPDHHQTLKIVCT